MRSPTSIDATCYRAALHLYPPSFRREFAEEIARVFDEARRDTLLAGGGLWGFRGRMTADLARAVVRQWLRTGWPAIAALAFLYPLTAASALSGLWRRLLLVLPGSAVESGSADMVLLQMLVAVVVLVVAATIILTLWFTRPLLYRRRG